MVRTFEEVSRFTVGAVGEPGDRTFYLQVSDANRTLSASIEKSQVRALAERLKYMLKEIRLVHPLVARPQLVRDSLPLELPVIDEFRIGSIAIFFDNSTERIQIDLRELQISDDEFIDESLFNDGLEIIRIFISPAQALTFIDRAEQAIASGRKPCPFCGLPINPDGHLCARANGYRR